MPPPLPHSTNTAWRNEGFRGYADHMQTASFESGLEFVLWTAPRGRCGR